MNDTHILKKKWNFMFKVEEHGEFDWDERTKGLILSVFFYGYTLTQIVGGRAAELFGGTRVFGLSIAGSGFLSLLIPVSARVSHILLIIVRFLQGLIQGPSWPAMHAITVQWIPSEERAKFVGPVYFATQIGVIIGMSLCGVLIDLWGWDISSYFAGVLACLWGAVWFWYTTPTPLTHPGISEEEREVILTSVRSSGTSKSESESPPWRKIFASIHVWATIGLSMGNSWGFSIILTQIPSYLKNIQGFSLKKNGLTSAMPFLSRYIGVNFFSFVCHLILSRKLLSVNMTRRVMSIFSMVCPGLCFIPVAFSGCSSTMAVSFLCLTMFFNGANAVVTVSNHMDLGPNYAGTLMGINNTAGSVIASFAPLVVGIIISDEQTIERWRIVFLSCLPIYIVPQLFFVCFSSGEVQPWNFLGQRDIEEPLSDQNEKEVKETGPCHQEKL
ncbi:putative transporter slc-17.2 isoform X2 [Oratosquilla oratoria]|uniref:putative transporter slc-17.2 isoform X2 n=1 Tax=Oratosquilla oratoria TaxID=337810 RepID=UPI003F759ABF